MNFNFNFESRKNHFLTSGISHPRWYLSPRFTVPVSDFLTVLKKYSVLIFVIFSTTEVIELLEKRK